MGLGPPICPDCYEKEKLARLLSVQGTCPKCGYLWTPEGRHEWSFSVPKGTTFIRVDGKRFKS